MARCPLRSSLNRCLRALQASLFASLFAVGSPPGVRGGLLLACLLVSLWAGTPRAAAEPTRKGRSAESSARSTRQDGAIHLRPTTAGRGSGSALPAVPFQTVDLTVEVQGTLKIAAGADQVDSEPFRVRAELGYDERLLESATDEMPATRSALRFFHRGKAELKIGKHAQTNRLSEERSLIWTRYEGQQLTHVCPLGPLTRDETEIISVQGSSLLVSELLPHDPVALEAHWKPQPSFLAALLGIDQIADSDVTCTLRQIEGPVALIDIRGEIQGAVDGVATNIDVRGKMHVDREQQRVSYFTLSLHENRAIGHAEPGVDAQVRLRMTLTPLPEGTPQLNDEAVAQLPETPTALLRLVSPEGRFQIYHDSRWRTMTNRHDVTILRMVDRGDLIAQCNISRLTDLPPNKQLSVRSFTEEVRRALDKNFGQLVEADETTTSSGLRILRVAASGLVDEVSVQWIYYHVADEEGRCASFVCTCQTEMLERLGEADRTLATTCEFLDDEPRPAAPE